MEKWVKYKRNQNSFLITTLKNSEDDKTMPVNAKKKFALNPNLETKYEVEILFEHDTILKTIKRQNYRKLS